MNPTLGEVKAEKSILKAELLNSISPLSKTIWLFFIDKLFEEISLEIDFSSRF